MADMKRLSYTSPLQLLSEKFHMSEAFLRQLNREATSTARERRSSSPTCSAMSFQQKLRASRSTPPASACSPMTRTASSSLPIPPRSAAQSDHLHEVR